MEDTSKTDISDENEFPSLFDYVKTNFSCLDILVNNAGILDDSTLKNWNLTSLTRSSMLICVAPIYAESAAADIMIEEQGVILNVCVGGGA